MTTLEAKTEKRGYFSIYKKGQGKWVRWGTVAAMALTTAIGDIWLINEYFALTEAWIAAIAASVWVILFAWLTFWLVNSPKMAEFMIATESEMRKVTWPSRREVVTSTKIIILLTFVLGLILYGADAGFWALSHWIGLN